MSASAPWIAAMRDASWWSAPGRARKYHVCEPWRPINAMCKGNFALYHEGGILAADVPPHERCQRPGCREAWARADEQRGA